MGKSPIEHVARSRGERVQALSAMRLRAVRRFLPFAARRFAGRLSVSNCPCFRENLPGVRRAKDGKARLRLAPIGRSACHLRWRNPDQRPQSQSTEYLSQLA